MPFVKQEQSQVNKICTCQEHNPPSHFYYQPGTKYVWRCPCCGRETVIETSSITC